MSVYIGYNGLIVSGWDEKKVPDVVGGGGWTTMSMYLIPLNCTL